jgi:hypothetical protein
VWNETLLDAIRIDRPKPPAHARNLFHSSAAMWDAWAARCGDVSNPPPIDLTEITIGIGGSLAAPALPHHRAYGSVPGGSAG